MDVHRIHRPQFFAGLLATPSDSKSPPVDRRELPEPGLGSFGALTALRARALRATRTPVLDWAPQALFADPDFAIEDPVERGCLGQLLHLRSGSR